jgi:hypothetical protein
MPKINIRTSISSVDDKSEAMTKAIIQDQIIKYKEDKDTTVLYDYESKTLSRENNQLRMKYIFDKENITVGNILIKDLNKELNVEIKTKKLERKDNDIEVRFIIENNEFLYQIEEIK